MRLIKRPNVMDDSKKFPSDIQEAVKAWCEVVKKAKWQHLDAFLYEKLMIIRRSSRKFSNF